MVSEPVKAFRDLVRLLNRYPEDAFLFVREGLGIAAERRHGPETEAHRSLHQFLAEHDLDFEGLHHLYNAGELDESIIQVIQAAGGWEKINRHVSGRDLCWALRDSALLRWGVLARTVLDSWNIRDTYDIGRIVFGFIDFELMRKQEKDNLDDFRDVFNFAEAFDEPFRSGLPILEDGDRC